LGWFFRWKRAADRRLAHVTLAPNATGQPSRLVAGQAGSAQDLYR